MSRRIETGPRVPTLAPSNEEEFLGRLSKYIPGEIVGVYLAATAPVPKDSEYYSIILWIIFGYCLFITPIYMWFATLDPEKGPLWLQVTLAAVAFPVWVFAVGGPFALLSWYEGWIATIAIVLVTFVFGMIKPKKGS